MQKRVRFIGKIVENKGNNLNLVSRFKFIYEITTKPLESYDKICHKGPRKLGK